jgi:uncharacterized protein
VSKSNGNGHVVTGSARIVATAAPTANVEKADLTINTPEALAALQNAEILQRQDNKVNLLKKALDGYSQLTTNFGPTDFVRGAAFNFLLDGPKDIDAECGYPPWLMPQQYNYMYDREAIAKRVVDCLPEETWAEDPEIWEDDDPDIETPFEEAWAALEEQHSLFSVLQRADVLSGIGQFGIILIGIDDGKDLREPVEGIFDDGTVDPEQEHKLLYLRVFSEVVVFVKVREIDITSPRYSQPKIYTIQFRDYPNWGVQAGEIIARDIHWTRVIHLADNRKESEVYGIPRMQPVYNRLYDLRKIYSSSGEGYWKGAFPGLAFEVNPEVAAQGVELDVASIRQEMERFQNGLQRYLALTGVTTKSLPATMMEPGGCVETQLRAIAICLGIPERILWGSEEAVLAGNQDSRAWNKRLGKRQTKYVNPLIIRPFINRLIAMGVLPPPKDCVEPTEEGTFIITGGYQIEWPDLDSPTDMDKAQIAATRTSAMAAYVQGGVSQLIAPREYLTHELGFGTEEADAIMEASAEFSGDEEEPLSAASQMAQEQEAAEQQHDQALELQNAKAKGGKGENTKPERNSAGPVGNARDYKILVNPSKTDLQDHFDSVRDKQGFDPERGMFRGIKGEPVLRGVLYDHGGHRWGDAIDWTHYGLAAGTASEKPGPDFSKSTPLFVHQDGSIRHGSAFDKLYNIPGIGSKLIANGSITANSDQSKGYHRLLALPSGTIISLRDYQSHDVPGIGSKLEKAPKPERNSAGPVENEGDSEEIEVNPSMQRVRKLLHKSWDPQEQIGSLRYVMGKKHVYVASALTHTHQDIAESIPHGDVSPHAASQPGDDPEEQRGPQGFINTRDHRTLHLDSAWRGKHEKDHPYFKSLGFKFPSYGSITANSDHYQRRFEQGEVVLNPSKKEIQQRVATGPQRFIKMGDDVIMGHAEYVTHDDLHQHPIAKKLRDGRGQQPLVHGYIDEDGERLGGPDDAGLESNTDWSEHFLVDPSKATLQTHLYKQGGLRGYLHNGHHVWTSAEDYVHHDLHTYGRRHGLWDEKPSYNEGLPGQRLFAKTNGEIVDAKDVEGGTVSVPGIGSKLQPARKFTANAGVDKDFILHNPDKGKLQAFFDTVAHRTDPNDPWRKGNERTSEYILRGIHDKGSGEHRWADANHFEHGELMMGRHYGSRNQLAEPMRDVSKEGAFSVKADGQIMRQSVEGGDVPHSVPGIGGRLKPALVANDSAGMETNSQWQDGWKVESPKSKQENLARQALTNPTREQLQGLLDHVHSWNQDNQIDYSPLKIVLRGVSNDDGSIHKWGSSYYHEHHDLKQGDMSLKNHLYVSTSGHIAKLGRMGGFEPFNVPAIGPKLQKVQAVVANVDKDREFSSTQIQLHPSIADRIKAMGMKIPDSELADDGREDDPHVTVKYGLHTNDPNDVSQLLQGEPAIRYTLGKTSLFPASGDRDYDVVKVDVHSPDLHRLNKKISDGLAHTDTHPVYMPHATVSYVKAGMGKKYEGLDDCEGLVGVCDHVVFSGKEKDNKTPIPLVVNATPLHQQMLTNPSKPDLQALFDTVHHRLQAAQALGSDDVVLRGVISRGGDKHVWGNAFNYEHEDLKDKSGDPDIAKGSHLYIHPSGKIFKFGKGYAEQEYNVPGIGSKLKPAQPPAYMVGNKARPRDMLHDQDQTLTPPQEDQSKPYAEVENLPGDPDQDDEENREEGGLGGANPDNGDALATPNLSREGVKHPVDPEMIQLPTLNVDGGTEFREYKVIDGDENE